MRSPSVLLLLAVTVVVAATALVLGQDSPFTIRVDVDLVSVDVSVFDELGRPVTHLTRDDFQIYEDGVRREIGHFASMETPYNVMSLLDCSGSVREVQPMIVEAFRAFLKDMRPQDRFAVAAFGASQAVLLDWTARGAMTANVPIRSYPPSVCGGTDLYGSLRWGIENTSKMEGRKGIIVFTDGIQAGTGSPPVTTVDIGGVAVRRIRNSIADTPFQTVLSVVRSADTVIYFIAVNTDLNPGSLDDMLQPAPEYTVLSLFNLQQVRSRMQQLAEASGGRVAFPKRLSDLIPTYRQIAEELGTSYSLGLSPESMPDGRFRRVEVRVRGNNMRVRQSRPGYSW